MDFWIYAVFLLYVGRLATSQRYTIENVQTSFRNLPPPRFNWKNIFENKLIQKSPDNFNGGPNFGSLNHPFEQSIQGLPPSPPSLSSSMPPHTHLSPHMLPPPSPPHMLPPPPPPHMLPPPPPPQMAPAPLPPQPLPPSSPPQSFMRNIPPVEFQNQRIMPSNSAPPLPPPPSSFRNRQDMYEPIPPNSPCPYCGRYGNDENSPDYGTTEECPCECEGGCPCENDYQNNPPPRGPSSSGNGDAMDYPAYEDCPCCNGNCPGNEYEGNQDYSYNDEPEPSSQPAFGRYSSNPQMNSGPVNYPPNSQSNGSPSQQHYSPSMQLPPPPPPTQSSPPRQIQSYSEIQELPPMMMSSNTQLLDGPPRGLPFPQGQGRMRPSQTFQQIIQRPAEIPPQTFPSPPPPPPPMPIPLPPPPPSASRVIVNRFSEFRRLPPQAYEGEMLFERSQTFNRPVFKEMNRRPNSFFREEGPKPPFFDNLAYSDSC